MEKYILIHCTEDGDKYFTVFDDKESLNKMLNEMLKEGIEIRNFIPENHISQNMDYTQGYILIKGEIIIPKVETVITKLTV